MGNTWRGNMDYNVVVVGAGMMGSAAAKYIKSQNEALHVCLIGPDEPEVKCEASMHGAHYDEARIARTADRDATWGVLAKRSVQRYQQIEQQSGLPIYNEVGYLAVGTADGAYITSIRARSESTKHQHTFLSNKEAIRAQFPYADFGAGVQAVHTPKNSGLINPRSFVAAQKWIAGTLGCHVIDEVVHSVQALGAGADGYTIKTEKGRVVTSQKVLLCTGGFTHCRDLLPRGIVPKMVHHPNTVILVEVTEDERRDMEKMPSMSFKGGPWDWPDLNIVAYILPPVRYPDGKYYLKLGHGNMDSYHLRTPKEITDWYRAGKETTVETYLYDVTRALFPRLKMVKYKFDYCVTTNTSHGYPYVDLVERTLGVAIGGCGQSAKSSDEIGKMAAQMIVKGSWDHDLPETLFKFVAEEPMTFQKLSSSL